MHDSNENRLAAHLFLRTTLPAVLTILLFLTSIFLVILPSFRSNSMAQEREALRELSQTVLSRLQQYELEERQGTRSREEAQKLAFESIRNLRYGSLLQNVFWLCDSEGRLLMHPFRPDLQGEDLKKFVSPEFSERIAEFCRVDARRQKSISVELLWKKESDTDERGQRLAFIQKFEDWNLLLGTDISLVDMQEEIAPITDRLTAVSLTILAILLLVSLYSVRHGLRGEFQRRKAAGALRQTRNYLQNIIDGMPSLVIGVDARGRITLLNRQARTVQGLSSDKAMGCLVEESLPYMADQKEKLALAIEEKTPQAAMKVPWLLEGETQYLDILIYPVSTTDGSGAVIRVDDVTNHARMEDMMVQTEKMMSVGGLAAGMAHEINNPLGGIMQGAQNISRRLSPELKKNLQEAQDCGTDLETIRSYLEKRSILKFIDGIRSSCERAARIVANMLEFSRRNESTMSAVNMEDLLEKTVELAANDYDLKKHYDFRHIAMKRDYEENLPNVFCESTRIEQVFLNLLKNAAQAMGGSSEEHDKPPEITLRLARDDGRVRIEILDNGPGMDEKTRKRAFEPFFTTKEVGVGTGLGLSVSYFIITENHKGSMALESSPGNGARFIIHLPIDRRFS